MYEIQFTNITGRILDYRNQFWKERKSYALEFKIMVCEGKNVGKLLKTN
jgi:hypothetical protein